MPKKTKNKGGRPKRERYSLRAAKYIVGPIVYGLTKNSDDEVVYVGITKNPYKRFQNYACEKYCHNPELKNWLSENKGMVDVLILEKKPKNIYEREKFWINEFSLDRLFNLVHGGDQAWRNHQSKPWMAGRGIKCPSDRLIMRLCCENKRRFSGIINRVHEMRLGMSDIDRCQYEVGIAMEFDQVPMFNKSMRKWAKLAAHKVIPVLENIEQ